VDAAIASGALRLADVGSCATDGPFVEGDRLPDGSSILRVSAGGACSCYDATARRCRIHAQLGHDALPVSCQHFPRVCLVDRDATLVTLSHYCPTAAELLFDPSPIAIVTPPPGFAPIALEGLDAREALPPLLRPRMLADRESYRFWERQVVGVLSESTSAEAALARIVDATERVLSWKPGRGRLVDAIRDAFRAARSRSAATPSSVLSPTALSFDALVRACVPAGLTAPPAPPDAVELDAELVAPRWLSFAAPIRRYLAARAFASWLAYQGLGLRTVACSLVAALSVLRVEAARQCATAGQGLNEALLLEAFRSADLLLAHLASREELARRLGAVEEAGPGEMREAITGLRALGLEP
jgi:hypothetical protein